MTVEEKREITKADWAGLVPPIFAECVDPESTRYCLSAPFLQDGFLYATDGRVAVRMPWPGEWTHQAEGRAPKMADVFRDVSEFRPDPIAMGEVVVAFEPCKECRGEKVLPERKCPECRGSGRVDCDCNCPHCDYNERCDECNGSGRLKGGDRCPTCEGWGIDEPSGPVEVDPGFYMSRDVASMLNRFGASVFPHVARPDRDVFRLVIGDVEGVAMPSMAPGGDS